jgi:hypothetical protein
MNTPAPAEMSLTVAAGLEGASSIQDRKKRAAAMIALKSFPDRQGPLTPARVADLISFENNLHVIIQSDKRWFFANSERTDAIQFARDMHVLHNFGAATTEQIIARRSEWLMGEENGVENDQLLQRVVALALHHYASSIKWSFFRHETVKPQIWPLLHAQFSFAESNGFATTLTHLFDAESHFKTSVQALYLRALLLDVLNTGSLSMPQIEIADGWLAEWTLGYQLDQTYSPAAHSLFVDLDASMGIQLVTGNTAWPSYRYLKMERLRDQAEVVRSELRVGRPYHGHTSSSEFPVREHVALLTNVERVYKSLLDHSVSHIEERQLVANMNADVRIGFEAVRSAIFGDTDDTKPTAARSRNADGSSVTSAPTMKFADLELSLSPVEKARDDATSQSGTGGEADTNAAHTARWKIHDMSSKGVGLLVERGVGEAVTVGQLLAIKPFGEVHWMLGVLVRKLTQRTVGETLLGVEILCLRPLPITLRQFAQLADSKPDPSLPPTQALYLPGLEQHGRADIIVMPDHDVGLKSIFGLSAAASKYRLRINRVLRKETGWMGVRFEVLGKD